MCVLILCVPSYYCMCPHFTTYTMCALILLHVSSFYYICVHMLLYMSACYHMCPHTTVYMSSYIVLNYYMCPHTTLYVSAYYDICVLILLFFLLFGGALAEQEAVEREEGRGRAGRWGGGGEQGRGGEDGRGVGGADGDEAVRANWLGMAPSGSGMCAACY
jgi:hypothetical protein